MEHTIKIYNSLKRQKELFEPIHSPQVKMYVCGPTVYDEPHIGHARSAYIFDVIRRYIIYKGYKVKFVRNVTDVDDKIIDKAKKECPNIDLISAAKEISDKYLDAYHNDMKQLGIMDPDVEPKATEFISSHNPSMQRFISHLIERGVAYVAGGDVYFDIKKAKDYGKLSNQSIDKMESGARALSGENKKDPLDFALWKAAKEGEPSWDSPWGKGRPGWHIECSVMSSDILGDEFDIHGGGIDLIFPHHENEIAQSEGAGKEFAKYWIHHGLLTINGQKMAKSLGNFITIQDVLKKYPVDVLKIFYLQAHYSNPLDFSWGKMEECKTAMERFYIFFDKMDKYRNYIPMNDLSLFKNFKEKVESIKQEFIDTMDNDFNTPQALSKLFQIMYEINVDLHNNNIDINGVELAVDSVKKLGDILSLSFKLNKDISPYIEFKIQERNEARSRKDFVTSDNIRKELLGLGIILEDTKDGTTWRRKL